MSVERTHRFMPDELSADQRSLYDTILGGPRAKGPQAFPLADTAGRLNGPFNALLLSPAVGTAVAALGAAIRYESHLSDRERELAILEVAVRRRCDFEWYAHVRVGRSAGLSEAEIAAILNGAEIASFNDRERLVRALVVRFLTERDLDDTSFGEAQAQLGAATLMDLIALTGYYDLLALSLRTWRIPLPDNTPPTFE